MRGKCSLELFDHARQSATDAFITASKRAIQKTSEATGDLIANKTDTKISLKYILKTQSKIIQRQLQISMIMKYLKKDMYLQKKYQEKVL